MFSSQLMRVHVVAFTRPSSVEEVADALGTITGVTNVIRSEMGAAAQLNPA